MFKWLQRRRAERQLIEDIRDGNLGAVASALDSGVSADARFAGMQMVERVIQFRQMEIFNLLVERGTDTSAERCPHLLEIVSVVGGEELAERLIHQGHIVTDRMVLNAVHKNNIPMAELLIAHGGALPEIDVATFSWHRADASTIKFLISQGLVPPENVLEAVRGESR